MPHVEVNGARLWFEEAGDGPPVVLVHGGLGDSRLWDRQFAPFAEEFRTIRYDHRFFGRSERPGGPYLLVDDLLGLLDALRLERTALVGLSLGGRVAIDAALAAPERVWALVPVCSGLTGMDADPYTPRQDAELEAALDAGDLDRAADIELAVWARLGATDELRALLLDNVAGPPADATPSRRPEPAAPRLGELRVPTLVVTGEQDVPEIEVVGDTLEREIPGARRVRIDSDHYLPIRQPETFNRVVLDFLAAVAPDR